MSKWVPLAGKRVASSLSMSNQGDTDMSNNTIIEVKNVNKSFGKKDNVTKVLNDASFSVERGEFVSLMGASGSGKSTLL